MQTVRIFLAGNELELYKDTQIGMSFKIADITEFTSVQSNVSTSIDIPYSNSNAAILEHALQVNSSSTIPYSANDCTLIINGVYIFQGGVLVIEEVNNENAIITIYSGVIDLLTQISGNINELNFSAEREVFSLSNIVSGINNTWTDGIAYAVINYGQINSTTLRAIETFPSVFAKRIFEKIINETSFTMTGDFWNNDTMLSSLVLPMCKDSFENGQTYIDAVSFERANNTTDTISDSETVDTTEKLFSLTGMSDTALEYVNGQYTGEVTISNYATSSTPAGGSVTASLVISKNNDVADLIGITTITGDGTFSVTTSNREEIDTGESVELAIRLIYAVPSGQTVTFDCDVDDKTFSTFDIDTYIQLDKTKIYFEDLLPEISKVDFLKGVMNVFGLTASYDFINSTLEIKQFNELTTNKENAKNWSDKIDFSKKVKIEFNASPYAKINTFQYTQDDNVTADLGKGTITIDNDNLDDNYQFVELPFSASDTKQEVPFQYVANVIKIDTNPYSERDELVKTEQRLCYTTNQVDSIAITDGATTTSGINNWLAGRFISPDETSNIGFNDSLITDYYEALEGVIQSYKKITAFFKLNELDIRGLDFFKPIFLNATDGTTTINGYFFINRVNNFTSNSSTEVELIKLDL